MTRYQGRVEAVEDEVLQAELTAPALTGATEAFVDDTSIYHEDGGQVHFFAEEDTADEIVTYTSVDDELARITLETPLANDYPVDSRVRVYPKATRRYAQVRVDDLDGEVAMARVRHALRGSLPTGIRERGERESVVLRHNDGRWEVIDLLGEEPSEGGGDATLAAPANVVLLFTRSHKHREVVFTARVRWDEATDPNVRFYVAQIRKCDAAGTFLTEADGSFIQEARKVQQKDADDDDPNAWQQAVFRNVPKKAHYKARVRAIGPRNEKSVWSAWTVVGTASDTTNPQDPISFVFDVDQHRMHLTWDYPESTEDTGTDDKFDSEEVAFFQCQVSNLNFSDGGWTQGNIIRRDRMVKGHEKTFRIKKPGNTTYYARVRAVDGSGNRSAWVVQSGNRIDPPTPAAPTITVDTGPKTRYDRVRVTAEFTGVSFADDDVDRYVVQLQVSDNTTFNDSDRKRRETVGAESDDDLRAVFKGVGKGKYVRARVRAKDKKGHYSPFSSWSSIVQANPSITITPPTNVTAIQEDKRAGVEWEYPSVSDVFIDDVDFFQIQGSKDGWASVGRKDMFHRSTKKMFKIAESTEWDFRVRAVDADGNKSVWVYLSGTTPAIEGWSSRAPFDATNNAEVSTQGGGYGYIGGGTTPADLFYQYDAELNSWTQKTSVPFAVASAGAMSYGNSLVVAQANGTGSTYTWASSTNAWTLRGNLPTSLGNNSPGNAPAQGTLCFFISGSGSTNTTSFDTVLFAYTSWASTPIQGRYSCASCPTGTGVVWSPGINSATGTASPNTYEFSTASNLWTLRNGSAGNWIYITSGAAMDGRHWQFGSYANDFAVLDPNGWTWTQKTDSPVNGGTSSTMFGLAGGVHFYPTANSHWKFAVLTLGAGTIVPGTGLKPEGTPPTPTITNVDVDPRRIRIDYSVIDDPADAESGSNKRPSPLVEYFQIEVATDSGFATVVERDKMHKAMRKVFTRKASGATFYVRVRSVNWGGTKSAWSTTVSATLQSPNMPQNLTPVSNDKAVGVDWEPPSNFDDNDPKIAFYQVQASSDGWASIATSSTGRTMKDMHVVATRRMFKDQSSTAFDFRVRSVSTSGEKSAWAYLSGTTAGSLVWTTKLAATNAHSNHGATLLNGLAHMVSGDGSGGVGTTLHDAYDPALNTWTSKAANTSINGASSTAGAVNGVMMAWRATNSHRYTPGTNAWDTRVALPSQLSGYATMQRHLPESGGRLFAFGNSSTTFHYDEALNSFTQLANVLVGQYRCGVTGIEGGKVYRVGGFNSGSSSALDDNVAYDISANTWEAKTDWPTVRGDNLGCTYAGEVWAGGGRGASGGNDGNGFWSFDPALNAWTSRQNFIATRGQGSMTPTTIGTLIAFGGTAGSGLSVESFGALTLGSTTATPGAFKPTGTPPAPTNLAAMKGIEMVGVEWDAPSQSGDPDRIDDRIEFFQVHGTQDGWATVWKKARKVNGTARRFYSEAFDTDHDFRVRSVGWDGTKSDWVYLSGVSAGAKTWTTPTGSSPVSLKGSSTTVNGLGYHAATGPSHYSFDAATRTYTAKAAPLHDYTAGGYGRISTIGLLATRGEQSTAGKYTEALNAWSEVTGAPTTTGINGPREHPFFGEEVHDVGGAGSFDGVGKLGHWKWNATSGTWTQLADAPQANDWTATTVVSSTTFLMYGGGITSRLYDRSSNSWSSKANIGANNITAGASLNDLVFGLSDNLFQSWDVAVDAWTSLTSPGFIGLDEVVYSLSGDFWFLLDTANHAYDELTTVSLPLKPKTETERFFWQHNGNLVVQAAGKGKVEADADFDLRRMIVNLDNAPTGSDASIELQRYRSGAWSAIATATIAAGTTRTSISLVGLTFLDGEYLRVRIATIGSTIPGGDDANVQVRARAKT